MASVHNNEPKSLVARFQLPADPSAPPVLTVTLTILFCSARKIYGKFLSRADRILAHALITLQILTGVFMNPLSLFTCDNISLSYMYVITFLHQILVSNKIKNIYIFFASLRTILCESSVHILPGIHSEIHALLKMYLDLAHMCQ